jgi:hypothetical protein
MKRHEYRAALKAAREEIDVLRQERDALDARIARLRQTIAALEAVCDEAPSFDEGLTEACRTVLKAASQPLSAVDVRGHLGALGLPMAKYSNPLASVHTVLKRLASAGEVSVVYGKGKPDAYQWTRLRTIIAEGRAAAVATWMATTYPRTRRVRDEDEDD